MTHMIISCLRHWLFHVKLCSYHAQFAWKITLSQTLHPLFVDIDVVQPPHSPFVDIDVAQIAWEVMIMIIEIDF